MIVIDASAAVLALMSNGEARQMLRSEDLHAPAHIDVEIVSAFRRHVRTEKIAPRVVEGILNQWSNVGLRRYLAQPFLARMWELHHNLTPYDAASVALAESLECSLLTADRGQVGAPGVQCPVMYVAS